MERMRQSELRASKGVYSIMSAFILITILIFVMLFLAFIGSSSIATIKLTANQTQPFQEAQFAKLMIEDCWKDRSGFTLSSMRGADKNFCVKGALQGYSIEVKKFFKCEFEKHDFGVMDRCNKKFPHYIPIADNNGNTCLGVLTLCYGGFD